MRTIKMAIALMASASVLAACGTTNGTDQARSTVGRSYGVYHAEGLPARDGLPAVPAAEWTSTEILDLQDLDASCHRQMDPQIPGVMREVFLPTGRMTLAAATGGYLGVGHGAVTAFTGVSFSDYAKYGGLASLGQTLPTSAVAYSERYAIARRYVQYACMVYATGYASGHGRLDGIGIILNPFNSDMNGFTPPTETRSGEAPEPQQHRSPAPMSPPF